MASTLRMQGSGLRFRFRALMWVWALALLIVVVATAGVARAEERESDGGVPAAAGGGGGRRGRGSGNGSGNDIIGHPDSTLQPPAEGDGARRPNRRRKKAKSCNGIWRPDSLPGKCFGLKQHNEYASLQGISVVANAVECRNLCCMMNEECVTWQYQNSTSKCLLGPAVRLGLEGADTPNWCDPLPPDRWNGRRLKIRNADGTCEWGEELPGQCFHLGPEKRTELNEPLNTEQCRKACCDSKDCGVWQEMPGRGCYYNEPKHVWCGPIESPYTGSRKCVPNFCGGLESQILEKGRERASGIAAASDGGGGA